MKKLTFKPKPGQIDYTNVRWAPVINCVLKYRDKLLMVQRSKELNFYPGYWNGISGFLDDRRSLNEKVADEIKEKIGMPKSKIKQIKLGDIFDQEEPKYKKTWIVHPVLVEVQTDKIKLDWEAGNYKWVTLQEAKKLKLLPGFDEVLKKVISMDTEIKTKIIIFDFGGQYAHLISRRVRELGFASIIVPSNYSKEMIRKDEMVKGLILSGGARSVYEKNAPKFDKNILQLGIPVLGICYGHQLIAHLLGGKVVKGAKGEYGPATISVLRKEPLFIFLKDSFRVWMNHRDTVVKMPKGFFVTASTALTPVAAFVDAKRKIYGVQFHPEVSHTVFGKQILSNFLKQIAPGLSSKNQSAETLITDAKNSLVSCKAIVGLSGGVDSSVSATLVSKAIGKNLLAVYVDTGLMRKGETNQIKKTFKEFPLKLKVISAAQRFFITLKGVTNPEEKRKRIGGLFIKIFEEEAKRFGAQFLIQGTIYSDRIENGLTKNSSKIKSHHNVGGLPKRMNLKVYEPLRELYKDEVRQLGRQLKLPEEIINRKVFPGPGLAIRIIGEVTPQKVDIVQRADEIVKEELQRANLFKRVWMAFPILLSIKSVGIQGDERSYKYPLVLRIVESKDAMTANFSRLPWTVLERISTRITNEISEVNRVVYDITNKPPATMEWE